MSPGCRVDNLVDSRKREVILGAVLVQGRIVNAHAKDVCILLWDEHRVCKPGGDLYFSDEICLE